ncbi:MAG TPA: phosphogluconate dehydratase [Oceanospirillales bacterium]|nr:phosphogluconate dehydratase [Oceanospirillales bacterium]|tara:strand:+ start:4969 stop:6852 length:1884 start_codon:yes stop_codon:yes gene_type:complete
MHPIVEAVTERIIKRSKKSRQEYLQLINSEAERLQQQPARHGMSCTNLAHAIAAEEHDEKVILKQSHRAANIAIVSAYNDVLSAHQPYKNYPDEIKGHLGKLGHVAQVAAGVPAMCDGVTQGQSGMQLSLFSRDAIALSTAIGLSHDVFDGTVLLGICDKIVPGLLMAALRFGHLPSIFLPSGPMASGISNAEKAATRQKFAAGEVGKDELLESELKSYHSAGTCTFYGTANSNQMLMEIMGLQLPGSSFLHPQDPLRPLLNQYALEKLSQHTALEADYNPLGKMLDEKSFVNAIVGLLATGGSTNHSIHILAIARMAGIVLDWQDISDLSDVVPLLTRMYPNGKGDVNHFQQAGGMGFLIRELLEAELIHDDVGTLLGSDSPLGKGMSAYCKEPYLVINTLENGDQEKQLGWREVNKESLNLDVLAPAHAPFMREGGLKLLTGNIGRGLIKISAVPESRWYTQAPAKVFIDQNDVQVAYDAGELNQDCVIVVKYQGPKANGMPELHKLMPVLANLQDAGYKVALLTDGRLSGASGKVPAALHVCPEALLGGAIDAICDGDIIEIDAHKGLIKNHSESVSGETDQSKSNQQSRGQGLGLGRELFSVFRANVTAADQGALSLDWVEEV